MTVYRARDLLIHHSDILKLPSKITIEFEDNVSIETTNKKAMYSRFFWLIHENYDKLPILSRHFVQGILDKNDNVLDSSTHIKLLSIIAKDTIKLYGLYEPVAKEHLYELIYRVTNNVYNELNKVTESSVITIDILDFLNLAYNEDIQKANKSLRPTPKNIEKIHKEVLKIILDGDPNNNIVKTMRAKTIKANQLTQCLSIRGYLSEVDGKILSTPVLSNFTLGLNKLYDFTVESRSAAKSLFFSETPLETAEYFARRLQLLSMYVDKLEYTDCGSTSYVKWLVRGPEYNEFKEKVYNGDLEYMKGKFYLNEATGSLLALDGSEKHLENTVISMRSPLTCKLPNKHHICSTCFGELAQNLHSHVNLGHICSASMTRQTSQSVLSNKHYQGSSITTDLTMNEHLLKYFTISTNRSALLLNSKLANYNPTMTITRDSALGLIDVLDGENIEAINPIYISSISQIRLSIEYKEQIVDDVDMLQSGRRCMMSTDLVRYISNNHWAVDEKGDFIFDLSEWDYTKDILLYPKKEYSFSDHSNQVASFIEKGISPATMRSVKDPVVHTLQELFYLVNSKLNVNISLLETILYAVTVPKEGENRDLSRHYEDVTIGSRNEIIANRSLSNLYAFEKQLAKLMDPRSFYPEHRPDSCFDVFVDPGSAVEAEKQTNQ